MDGENANSVQLNSGWSFDFTSVQVKGSVSVIILFVAVWTGKTIGKRFFKLLETHPVDGTLDDKLGTFVVSAVRFCKAVINEHNYKACINLPPLFFFLFPIFERTGCVLANT